MEVEALQAKQKWYPGDSVSVGIGQGYNLATPLQLAFATATLANGGVVYQPHIVRHVDDARNGETRAIEPQPVRTRRSSTRSGSSS